MARAGRSATTTFWDFSLACYARTGVAKACLDLQDRRGLDVNMLLFGCYAAHACGVALSVKEILAFESAVVAWQAGVVLPLRAARRALTDGLEDVSACALDAIKTRIKEAELAAEQAEQDCLAALLARRHEPVLETGGGITRAIAHHNLRVYLSGRGHALELADERAFQSIVDGCFPDT